QYSVEVFRHVNDDGDIHGRAAKARPPTARKDGCTILAADFNRTHHVGGGSRNDDSDRRLCVVRRVISVQASRSVIEPYFAGDTVAKVSLEGICIDRFTLARIPNAGINDGRPWSRLA